MAVALGKRKRRTITEPQSESNQSGSEDESNARALFQRAFEAKFEPLDKPTKPVAEEHMEHEDDDGLEEENWSGLSENEDEDKIETIEFAQPTIDDIFAGGKKKFMSSKPPTIGDDEVKPQQKSSKSTDGEDGTESTNLKNDLALQRLLKESHILDPATFHTSSALEGKGRLKALDSRFKDLGAKTSLLEQEKMPLSHRKGITAKSTAREANRRKEAAENGVILERVKFKASGDKRRERSVGGPGVGKFRGGTLKLSKRDISSIQNSGPKDKGRKGGMRR
ncbi:hypothetical protein DOTSEDRAFT_80470 [Dothistroma septosporum NZE10]|uniref:Protein FAF1 n=1 Tax=Dothistroma septosporum (strain NZE10 / CBS 128990) TaxID=675120 RepID=M2Y3L1_DOTSN|nr:hypothetical protein DOTSEDRAFT_80470 [Dothistroma septosporum NZE10]